MKHTDMEERIVTTCFGKFRIEGGIARFIGDDDFYYNLPMPDMTNDEIKDYFRILKEQEE